MKQDLRIMARSFLVLFLIYVGIMVYTSPVNVLSQDYLDHWRRKYSEYKGERNLITSVASWRSSCIKTYTEHLNAYYHLHKSYPERLPVLQDEDLTQKMPCGAKAFNVLDERDSIHVVYSKYSRNLETRFSRCREALLYYTYAQQQGFGLTLCSSSGDWVRSGSMVFGSSFYKGQQLKEDTPWPIVDAKKGRVYDYGYLAHYSVTHREVRTIHDALMKEVERDPKRFFSYAPAANWYGPKENYPEVW